MENLEIHFFHGFLGTPEDWGPTINALNLQKGVRTYTHSLIELYNSLEQDRSLAAAAKKIQSLSLNTAKTKLVVGYSLGGRLLMHLYPESFDRMLLLGSHPGLVESVEQRKLKDAEWIKKGHRLSQQEWLKAWNQQDVFSFDRNRPHRQFTDQEFQVYIEILEEWSVAKQKNLRNNLQSNGEKIFWAYGEEDKKYGALSKEIETLLPNGHVLQIPEAGHGVLFDQPQQVAWAVERVANYDH